ncbi:glycosyltransferase [Rhodothermus profundi]|uniref:Glycosyltransferase involved in cell wall bisynthesis n=1 Tax=Rhodothermus profundi TaxID=633813 RepID=A0A1M6RCS4_9BACT|nr:glycosyltransferase [Rhodothermus profundi]SHK30200.1 Glycosyltransferase involved in cell wall bisynthesis [Rhodothermus profundi]
MRPIALHFKSVYLNLSETFIDRLVRHHERYRPVIGTLHPRYYLDGLSVYTPSGWEAWRDRLLQQLNRSPRFLYQVCRQVHPVVLHAHFGLDGYRLLDLSRHTRLPLVVSFYGHDVSRLPAEPGWRRRYQRLARQGTCFIAATNFMKQQLITLGFPEEKIAVVRFGIDLSAFPFRLRTRAGFRLLMVGRLVEKKGHHTALKAVARLRASGYAVELHCYGDGPLRTFLQAEAHRLGISAFLSFHGAVTNEVARQAYYTHDVLLVPSQTATDGDQEGLPNVLIEGLASGIPVVATQHAGIPELIVPEKTGLLVAERDAEALAVAIKRLLETPALVEHLSRAGRAAVEAQHSLTRMVRDTEAVYDAARHAL